MKCLRCGRCCRELILEIGEYDVLREAKVKSTAQLLDGHGTITWDHPLETEYSLPTPCPFIGSDNLCTIYPTRPNLCVGFEARGEQCRALRGEPAKRCQSKQPGKPVASSPIDTADTCRRCGKVMR